MYYDSGRRKNVYVWIVILVIVVGLLNTPAFKGGRLLKASRSIATNVFYPFKLAGTGLWVGTTHGVTGFFHVKGVQKENEQLKADLEEMKAKLVLADDLTRENNSLREAMGFRSRYSGGRLIPAEIVGRTSSNWFEVIEINRGLADNVVPDTAVINHEGLVGRVFESTRFSSKVLLVTDPTSAISIIDPETGDMAIASGNTIGPLGIKYMPASADIKVNDRIITSGMSDIFPKGILVGTVKSVSKKDFDIFQKVDVQPAVNFSKLDKLFVVVR
jgi:rod shape-determining protein MreC